jgi:hypothetical protein
MHTYQVPVFVEGVDPATVTWGSSEPTMVAFQAYVRGVMITTRKAGDVTIVARMGSMCGSGPLHITTYTADDWSTGNSRYNNGNPLNFNANAAGVPAGSMIPDGGFDGSFDASAACTDPMFQNLTNPFEEPPAACTNCHGDMSNGTTFGMTVYSDVEHTPEQTGGLQRRGAHERLRQRDDPRRRLLRRVDYPVLSLAQVAHVAGRRLGRHAKGVLAYLRSLTPQEQLGCFELFNAAMCADGG